MDYRYGGFTQMSASRGNDANGGHVSGESGNCGQRRHSSPGRAKLLMGLEMQAAGPGIQRSELLEIVGGGRFSAPVTGLKSARMVARRYLEPDFRLCLMAKDLRVAVQAASENGRDLPMAVAASAAHDRAWGNGRADLDCAAIADALNGSQP
jgi:hypothetical protein